MASTAIFNIEDETARLAFVGLYHDPTTVETATGTSAMRQNGFPALGAGAPLRGGQGIVGTPLLFHSFRSSSLRYRHF
jgi:hypothetical protein